MENRTRLLGIVPYEGIKTLMNSLAQEYPQAELDVFVGNMEEGMEIAKNALPDTYDAVISRGGTAQLLSQLPIPVIDIEISLYDILYALKLSGSLHGKLAMVAYANITINAQILCDLLKYPVDIFTVKSIDDLEPTLQHLREAHYDTVLCDMTADMIAMSLGLNTIFITSGLESIRRALDQALALCRNRDRLQSQNELFRELLDGQNCQTAVFDQEKNLVFSSGGTISPELLEVLRRELDDLPEKKERRTARSVGGTLYAVRVRALASGMTAVYLTARKSPFSKNQSGIQFFSRREAEVKAYSDIFSFQDLFSATADEVRLLSGSMVPILITGEAGTCMSRAAAHLYIHGPLRDAPLVSINCSLLNDRSWEFLLESHNSPLPEPGNTLYFSHIDALTPSCRRQLMETLSEAGICRRSRVIFSCICPSGEQMSPEGAEFLNRLNCRSLYLQPLRKLTDRIPAQINSALSHLNASRPYPVLGIEPEALRLLQAFSWPHNYTQFQRVIEDLAATSEQIITAGSVRAILKKEQYGSAYTSQKGGLDAPLDLNQTLDQIEREVALRVLAETGGNQSAAAKRLDISRTTLRRLVKTS